MQVGDGGSAGGGCAEFRLVSTHVVDAAHDADAIAEAVGDRRLTAIVYTRAHNDHIDAAPALADRMGATIWLHRDDLPLWKLPHPDRGPDAHLADGQFTTAAGIDLTGLQAPGHASGAVFTGDAIFHGGPGATGRSYSCRVQSSDAVLRARPPAR
ncbi:MBL fold metallo-hydrolase [Streptomyces olivochromogenes]|nr:MBL fold metallo-hydrolase [Streptomyces olivochromogenes]